MNIQQTTIPLPDWASISGDIWARRWEETDAGLAGLSPHLLAAVEACAPARAFNAFEIGCGPGTTTIEVADALPQARTVACDISPSLAEIARYRLQPLRNVRVVVGDAEAIAAAEAPIDLFFSRHGVMFFDDPERAFIALRGAAAPGASLVFSCFRAWQLNPWASELASAAAGGELPAPGREPSGFAFAEPDYVRDILRTSGWAAAEPQPIDFDYVAGRGEQAVDDALAFMADLGPAARVLDKLSSEARSQACGRMRGVIARRFDGESVAFPAAAWIWSARAG